MAPLSVRFAFSRFLDPALLLIIALGVGLFLALRGSSAGHRWGLRPHTPGASSRRQRIGRGLAWTAWAALWIVSTPLAANRLNACVETGGPDLAASLAGKDPARGALVVLAGGLRTMEPSLPPRERLDTATTARVLGAARLYHAHGFGTVVLSGAPEAESEAMDDLITTLGVPEAKVVRESASLNTRQNAEYCAALLRARGIETVVLATSANHLRRAVREFERAGMPVIPAPVDITGVRRLGVDQLLPASTALGTSHLAIHEILGYLRP